MNIDDTMVAHIQLNRASCILASYNSRDLASELLKLVEMVFLAAILVLE